MHEHPIPVSDRPIPDRLSALVRRLSLSLVEASADGLRKAHLTALTMPDGRPYLHVTMAVLHDPQALARRLGWPVAFTLTIDWGMGLHPLLAILPPEFSWQAGTQADALAVVALLEGEIHQRRCGAGSIIARLAEILLIHLLRRQIEQGQATAGLLAGLADKRICRAIVAMHDRPGHGWSGEELAQVAGLSRSRFSEIFHQLVGEAPSAYLRRWRMVMAYQDLQKGERVQQVAHRYGYSSREALARVMRRFYGKTPKALQLGKVLAA